MTQFFKDALKRVLTDFAHNKLLTYLMASILNKPLRLENFLAVVRPSLKSESIFIRLHNGNGCCVQVDPSDTLKDVFSSIHVK